MAAAATALPALRTANENPLELFVRRLVREFILRLHLPNEPGIEAELIEKVTEYLKDDK